VHVGELNKCLEPVHEDCNMTKYQDEVRDRSAYQRFLGETHVQASSLLVAAHNHVTTTINTAMWQPTGGYLYCVDEVLELMPDFVTEDLGADTKNRVLAGVTRSDGVLGLCQHPRKNCSVVC